MNRFKQWHKDSLVVRNKAKVSPTFAPWSSRPGLRYKGVRLTERVKDLMDCTLIDLMVNQNATMSEVLKKDNLEGLFLDYSQSHHRRCFTAGGMNKCLTTSSTIYSFGRDRMVLPMETLHFHGYPKTVRLPVHCTQNDLKQFAGEAMTLPCLATVLYSIIANMTFDKPATATET